MCPEVKQLQTVVIFVEESVAKRKDLDVFMKSICQDYLNREIMGQVQLRSGKLTKHHDNMSPYCLVCEMQSPI